MREGLQLNVLFVPPQSGIFPFFFQIPVHTNPEKLSGQNGNLLECYLNVCLKTPGLRFSFVGKHFCKRNFWKTRSKAGVLGNAA